MNELTKRLLQAFFDNMPSTLFLTGMFRTDERSFYNGQTVTIDIVRSDQSLAVAIQDVAAGYHLNKHNIYTNKEFTAPVLNEGEPLNVFDLMKRMPGQDPFRDPDFQADGSMRAVRAMSEMTKKIRRSIEYQAAQIMQTGAFTYIDANGNTIFTVDFNSKASHLITAGTPWSDAAADPLQDLENACDVIKQDSGREPDMVVMGAQSYREFIRNAQVLLLLDNRRVDLGGMVPPSEFGDGGKYMGNIAAGPYRLDIYTYPQFHNDIQTPANKVPYIANENVIVRSSAGRLEATYGSIPRFGNPNQDALPFLPQIADADRGLGLSSFAFLNAPKTALTLTVGTRPLLIPVEIDSFARIAT